MKVVYYEVGKSPIVKDIDGSLDSLQFLVEGYIQAVTIDYNKNITLICNEEGLINSLRFNRKIEGHFIFGNFIICEFDEMDFCSLSSKNLKFVEETYK